MKKYVIIFEKSVKGTVLPAAQRCNLLNCLPLGMLTLTRMAPAKASSSLHPHQSFPAPTCSPCTSAPSLRGPEVCGKKCTEDKRKWARCAEGSEAILFEQSEQASLKHSHTAPETSWHWHHHQTYNHPWEAPYRADSTQLHPVKELLPGEGEGAF